MSETETNTTTKQAENSHTEEKTEQSQSENPPAQAEQSAGGEKPAAVSNTEQPEAPNTEQPKASNAEQSEASSTEQPAQADQGEQPAQADQGEQPAQAADKHAEPAKSSAPAKKEEKPDTKLPKEFKRGFDVSHYQLERLLDNQKGLFIFAATNHKDDEPATIRIERIDAKHPGLLNEIAVIPYLSESLSFPRFYECGEENGFRWVTSELLGPSLKFVKWKLPHQRFTQYSALHGSLALLRSIEDLHKRGIVHGDIQPDNVLIRPNKEHPLVLTNFQMSKRYCWPEGVTELPPLDMTPAKIDLSKITQNNEIVVVDDYGFKSENKDGDDKNSEQQASENQNAEQQSESQANESNNNGENSNTDNNNEDSNADGKDQNEGPQIRDPTIFDSVNALQGGEITRVDDLESWFYIMVDMLEGKLPFSVPNPQTATKESILSAKQGVSPETLTKDLPDKLKDTWTYISSLTPTDEPDYDKIGKNIVDTIQELKLIPDDYDWNKLPVRKVKKISAIDFRALNGETNYLPIFDHERNVSQTPPLPPPSSNCLIA